MSTDDAADSSKRREHHASRVPAKPVPGPAPSLRDKPALRRVTPVRPVQEGQRQISGLPPLPQGRRPRKRGTVLSFIVAVVVPVLLISVYYFGFASNQYVAEFRFSVTEMNPILPGTSSSSTGKSESSGFAGMLGGFAVSNVVIQNYVVTDFLSSRQCVEELMSTLPLIELYSRPEIDWWYRFNPDHPREKFVEYWKSVIFTTYDPITGIAIARVSAFTPEDALRIAQAMVKLAEDLVNRIALRAQTDAVRFAEAELARAEDRMKNVSVELLKFRLREGMIDPTSSAISPNIALAQQLRMSLLSLETELSALRNRSVSATAPAVTTLNSKIAATKQELQRVEKEVSQDREGANSLADVMARYEKLDLERQYASAMLVSSKQALDTARGNAAAQHLYLTPFVRPSLPESSTQPHRFAAVLKAFLGLLLGWLGLLTLYRSIKDHVA